jgi:hypothetical protein
MGEKGCTVRSPLYTDASRSLIFFSLVRDCDDEPHLARFKGRPGEMSPKARFWMLAGWLLPSRFKYVRTHCTLNGF